MPHSAAGHDDCSQVSTDPLNAIQIDGGSKFMAGFEQACADRKLPLYVLPPALAEAQWRRRRCNAAWQYEFYPCVELPEKIDAIAEHVDAFQTPCRIDPGPLQNHPGQETSPSHMA
jgi:hypothetical protein